MDVAESDVVEAQVEQSTSTTSPTPEAKRGGLFGFLRKGSSQALPKTEQATAVQTETDPANSAENPSPVPSPEAVIDPETLKGELRESLVRLVNLQNEVYFKTRSLPRDTTSEAYLEEKVKLEGVQTEAGELNAQLLEGLWDARETLGHFCKVIQDQAGNKAVILRTPLTREITQTTFATDPTSTPHYKENEPFYRTHSEVQDIFIVNKAGVYRHSVENPQAHTLESVGNPKIDEPFKEQFGGRTFRKDQQDNERKVLENDMRGWHAKLDIAFNDEPSKDNDYVFNDFTAGNWARRTTEGEQEYDTGLAEPLFRKYGSYGPQEGITRVSTSLDAAAAFDASVEDAKGTVGKPEGNWLRLYDPQPNPVSAEPMSKEAWNPEPYEPSAPVSNSVPAQEVDASLDATQPSAEATPEAPANKTDSAI